MISIHRQFEISETDQSEQYNSKQYKDKNWQPAYLPQHPILLLLLMFGICWQGIAPMIVL